MAALPGSPRFSGAPSFAAVFRWRNGEAAMARNTDGAGSLSASVRQAQDMVSIQLGCELDDALTRMYERADETGETLDDVAADVVARLTRFHR
jgi:hypothetical protein